MRRSQVPSLKKQRLSGPGGDATFRSTASSSLDQSGSRPPATNQPAARSFTKPTDTPADGNQSASTYQVFTVVYGVFKPGKKHKEWNDDAILVLDGKSIRIYNLEGEKIDSGHYVRDKPLKRDDTLMIGSKEYMMIDPINKDDFISGRCFQEGYSADQTVLSQAPAKPLSASVQKSLKRKFGEYLCPLPANGENRDGMPNGEMPNASMMEHSRLLPGQFVGPEESKKENELYQVFTAIYGPYKPGKKHKEFEGDAILMRKGANLTLYDMEGETVCTDFHKKNKTISAGEVLLVDDKEVRINDPFDVEQFENRRCFQAGFQVRVPENVERPVERPKMFKSVITSSTIEVLDQAKRMAGRSHPTATEDDNDFSAFEVDPFELPAPPDHLREFHDIVRSVDVDTNLNLVLRDHQRDGIVFMYKCITGFDPKIRGCILADEMGLGKTLQCIVLIYTLLKDGPFGEPLLKRVLVLAPSSLVQNWAKEFEKWLKGRRNFYPYAVDGKKNTVKHFLKQPRTTYPVLIISYDTFHRNATLLANLDFDLVVCDEGHRLKNSKIKIFETISKMPCQRKIILTGTPVQNNLKELYSLSSLVNPGILGTPEEFHENFEAPINQARKQSDESENENYEGSLDNLSKVESEVHFRLFSIVNQFLLRRQQSSFNYLPKKTENVVICRLTDLQEKLYNALLDDKQLKRILGEESGTSTVRSYLPYIAFLRKLCNHPFLVNKAIIEQSYELKETSLVSALWPAVAECFAAFPKGVRHKSGKFDVFAKLLELIREINEKVVIVSHFTQTLDLLQQYCRSKNYKTSRLDGSTPVASRQKLVDEFNSECSSTFAFLLSSKAGGLGLNLVGASHIILYDIDWNPSFDLQSMARIWRDGQKKPANVYRLLTVGTIEEKIFQRQLDKQNLGSAVGRLGGETQFSISELRDIFRLQTQTLSSTHDAIKCDCLSRLAVSEEQAKPENESSVQSDDEVPNCEEYETEQNYGQMDFDLEEDHAGIRTSTQQVDGVRIKTENRTLSSQELFGNDDDDQLRSGDEEDEEERDEEERDEEEGDEEEGRDGPGEENDAFDEGQESDEGGQNSDEDEDSDKIAAIRSGESSGARPVYDDEDSLDASADQPETSQAHRQIKYKPLIEWQHFSFNYSYDFEIDSMLLEAKDNISFLFKTVQE